jgi:formamidopyrimidine-DNA glycosylase
MPELPEVEAVVRTLRPLVVGRRIHRVRVFHAIVTKPQPVSKLARLAQGRKIHRVNRRGKYLLLELDRGFIVMHFRLDGQLVWFEDEVELRKRANQKVNGVHVDVAFELDGRVLGFADRRHFGRVHAWPCEEDCPSLQNLGIDAMSREFSERRLEELLASSNRPLKEFLLDQTHVAGIGNIYSCEALWHAKLDPKGRTKSLTEQESRRLHKAIVSVLRRALECCLQPPPDFRNPEWWFQGLEKMLRAYGREAQPCHRCGAAIRRIEQGGRSTYFCAGCQTRT